MSAHARRRLTGPFALALACALAILPVVPRSAMAQAQPAADCIDCKHLRCLESLKVQREALATGYEAIETTPILAVRDPVGKTLEYVNTDGMSAAEARGRLAEIRSKMNLYQQSEARMVSRVPSNECGASATETIAAETDPVSCIVDAKKLTAAVSEMPCKQLGDMIRAHESFHQRRCIERKHTQGQSLPYRWLTPVALAAEEAGAYRDEVATIQKLIDQIKEPRLVSEAVSVIKGPAPLGTIRSTVLGTFVLKVDKEHPERISGMGESVVTFDTSGSQCSLSGGKGPGKMSLVGRVSNGKLAVTVTSLVRDASPLRVTCPKGFGFSSASFAPSTMTLAYEDAATVTQTLVDNPMMKASSTYTLHLKCSKRSE